MSVHTSESVESPLWSIKETAAYLALPVSTLHYLVATGAAPPSFKIGKARKFDRGEVVAWLEERKRAARVD